MSKVAFITGINGQDGSYLAEHLLNMGYEVHGMVRRNSMSENQDSRVYHLTDQITTHYGDLMDESSIDRILEKAKRYATIYCKNKCFGCVEYVRVLQKNLS